MRELLTALLAACACLPAAAQQEAHFTQWAFDKLNLNPAYAGVKGRPTASALVRSQWVGFEGAPSTQAARFHVPVSYGRVGLGAALENDMIGATRGTQLKLAYAYHIELGRETHLSLGIEGALRHVRIDYSEARVNDLEPLAEAGVSSRLLPNVGLGAYLYSEVFYVGAAISRLRKNTLFAPADYAGRRGLATEVPHLYAMAGVSLPVGYDLDFRPGVLVKHAEAAPSSVDLNAMFVYDGRYGGGATLRGGEGPESSLRLSSVALVGQVAIGENGMLGASYDLETTRILTGTVGGFELAYEHIWGRQRRPGIPCYWH